MLPLDITDAAEEIDSAVVAMTNKANYLRMAKFEIDEGVRSDRFFVRMHCVLHYTDYFMCIETPDRIA
jgi:hypothetical protein